MKSPRLLILLAINFALAAHAQYAIGWWTIDGGGGTSTGGVYVVRGTIGQADAGVLTNSTYRLEGGFWGGAVAIQTPGAPTLYVTNTTPGRVTLWWVPSTPGFVLEESPTLQPAAWSNAASGTNNPVNLAAPLPAKFYRLRKP